MTEQTNFIILVPSRGTDQETLLMRVREHAEKWNVKLVGLGGTPADYYCEIVLKEPNSRDGVKKLFCEWNLGVFEKPEQSWIIPTFKEAKWRGDIWISDGWGIVPTTRTYTLYVLELRGDKWYVGITTDLDERLREHREGRGEGSTWTKTHQVVDVAHKEQNAAPEDEDKFVLMYMKIKGIENVRGGNYSKPKLPIGVQRDLQSKIWHNEGKCIRCGHGGHFIKQCTAQTTSTGKKPWINVREY